MRKLAMLLIACCVCFTQVWAQNRVVTGKITDEVGNPLSGATVSAVGGKGNATTNASGDFSLTLSAKAQEVEITYVGFATQRLTLTNQTTLSVKLSRGNSSLDEVVVTGYQTVRRSEVTGSVAKISGTELAQKPIGSFTQLLQGKATGVQATGQSGRPGANANIRIRGAGSVNASSEPLIIVDGFAVSEAAYNMLNPNDIEDINVLKDASASSIYGSRAANGVLVITTKKGKAGKPELRYSFQYGKSKVMDLQNIELMDAQQKLQYEYELGYTNPLLASRIATEVAAGRLPTGTNVTNLPEAQRRTFWDSLIRTGAGDWSKYLLQEGITRTHEISISGADDKFKYYFSGNKNDNDGVQYGSYWNRKTGRLNVEYTATDWFRLGTNLSVSHTKENFVRELNNTQNLYAAIFRFNPYEPVFTPDGKYNNTFQGYNPIEGTINNPDERQRVSTFASIFGEIRAFSHLTLKSQIGVNYNTLKRESYSKPGSNLATILGYNSKTDQGNQDLLYTFTNTANWRQTFKAKHSINLLAGTEFTKDNVYSYLLTGRGFPTASVTTLENAGTPTAASTSRTQWALISYFANATYDYGKKYFVNFSGRRDGSSRFGVNNRFANFWAVGAAWDLMKENFLKVDQINTLKLKASIGTAGNFNIGNYDALGTYALSNKYFDLPSATPFRLPNPNLTWEENKNFDIGLDFGILSNRITGTLDYYNRKTNNLLYPVNVSAATGFSSYTGNIGSLTNKGYEVLLSGDIIRNKSLRWNVSVSYTHNDNKVNSLYSDNAASPGTGGLAKLKVGEIANTYFMVKWAGINPANGKNQFYNIDGTITETYSSGQSQLFSGKSPLVKYYGSVNTDVSYKGFDLSAQLYYSGGNYIMNYMYQIGANDGETKNIPQFTDVFNYWKKAGDQVYFANPLDPTQNKTYDTDKYLEKGDYITLRDATIGYTLNSKILTKLKYIKGFRVYAQGTNLFIKTKFRGLPEVGESNREQTTLTLSGTTTLYAYPQIRAFTFGLDVKF